MPRPTKVLPARRPDASHAIVIEAVLVENVKPIGDEAALRLWLEGVDTCAHLSDDQIGLALIEEPLLTFAAQHLTQAHGQPVARADLERRIVASPRLQNVHAAAQWVHEQVMLAKCQQILARAADREAERECVREQRHLRNRGPRCGARTRSGRPCNRKVALGRRRCPSHGGAGSGPKTPSGKARSLANLRLRWKNRKAARG